MLVDTQRKVLPIIWQKSLFLEAYPIKKKYVCNLRLDKFVKEYGAPDKMTYDGAQEKRGRKNKPNIELWEDLSGDDKIFHEEFARVITNEDIPEADDIFDPEEFENYVNMELAEFSRVNTILKDKDDRTIVNAADNPILDTRMHEVEYTDGYKTAMTANAIASTLFSQFDQDGQHFLLFNAIIYLRTNSTQIKEGDSYIYICPMERRGVERPPKDGKFSYNGNMGVLLGTKLRTSRSPFRYN